MLPLGPPAQQQAVLSAVSAIAAALVVGAIVHRLGGGSRWNSALAGALAALWLGWSPRFWSQAVIVEIYSLHLLFCASLWWYAVQHRRPGDTRWGWGDRAAGFIAGLALGNHLTVIFPILVVFGFAVLHRPRVGRLRRLAALLLWAALGVQVYLYLPLVGSASSAASWGDPSSVAGLHWLVTGELYQGMAFTVSPAQLAGRLRMFAAFPLDEFGPVGLAMGLWGLARARADLARLRAAMGVAVLATAAFALGYSSYDAHVYLLPLSMLFAVWVGVGVTDLLARVESRPPLAALTAAALLASAALTVPSAAAAADARGDRRAIEFASRVLREAPAGAILLTSEDRDTFPLWYYHVAQGMRPDLAVVAGPLLPFDWYQANLQEAYPSLRLPASVRSGWDVVLLTRNPGRPFCWTQPGQAEVLRCTAIEATNHSP
jgi:hypothetical protein